MRAQLAWWLRSALRSGDRDRRRRVRVAVDAGFTRGVGTVALGVLPIVHEHAQRAQRANTSSRAAEPPARREGQFE